MNEEIRKAIANLDDSEIVALWNDYCMETNRYDDEIMDTDTLSEYMTNDNGDPFYWVNRFYFGSDDYGDGSANPNRDYFVFNGYGNIVSFDYIYNSYSDEFNHIDIDDLIDYIIDRHEPTGHDEIDEILENDDEETDEE